jgi:hypothetical protein
VSPILGIWASQNYVRIPPTSYESISTVTVGSGGSSVITFSSIPSTFKHLQVRFIARCGVSGEVSQGLFMRINSDTASNYSHHSLYGTGATAGAGGSANQTYAYPGFMTGPNATSNNFGTGVIDILDYADTNKNKTIRALTGYDNNGAGLVGLLSSNWRSTTAISSLSFLVELGGGSFTQYTHFALYGIK